MFGKLSVALLLLAAPAIAQEAPPPAAEPQATEPAVEAKSAPFKLKKICRPQEVVGSSIPRNVCTTKRIYLKPGEEAQAENKTTSETQPEHSQH